MALGFGGRRLGMKQKMLLAQGRPVRTKVMTYIIGSPYVCHRYALCVRAKHRKCEGVMGSGPTACGLMVGT
jgi:hypothetical protein